MTKLDRLVSNSIFKIMVPAFGLLIMALGSALFAQTVGMVKTNESNLEKHCDKTETTLSEKVNKDELKETLRLMEKNSDRQWETMKTLMQRSEKIDKKVDNLQSDIDHIKEKIR